ncbi:RadC family protein [Salinisphaera orenii]|uniref:RadC family protein n=1 Tax=Salinisphaera orenii TaxID=856731 RepID=UPI000DBE084C
MPTLELTEEDAQTVQQALTIIERSMQAGDLLSTPDMTRNYLRLKLAGYECEVFGAVFLTTRHRVIDNKVMFRGTIDGAAVYPREIAKEALSLNAAALILYHNHPSGTSEPSRADRDLTGRIRDALALFDMRILDHLIVTESESTSMAERGLI